jgi:hypothetical protein
MAAKRVNKKKGKSVSNKGIGFISKQLRKKYSSQFKTRGEASDKAKELLKIFRERKELITVKGIKKYLRTTGKRTKAEDSAKVPFIVGKMLTPIPFYNAIDYTQMTSDCDSNVTFISDIFDYSVPALKGGDFADYSTYFKAYVDYCNEFVSQDPEEYKSSDWAGENMCIMTLPPEKDARGRWVCEIVVTDGEGTIITDMYGFAPNGESDFEKGEVEVIPVEKGQAKAKREKKRKEVKKDKGKGDGIEELRLKAKIKEAEARKAEAQTAKVKEYAQLLREGLITKADFIKFIKE